MRSQVSFIPSGTRHWRCVTTRTGNCAPDTAWDFSSCLEGLWQSIVLPVGCGPRSAEMDTEEGERSELSFSPAQEQGNIPGT